MPKDPNYDSNTFRKLYDEYSAGLFRYIFRFTANTETAEEILQEVFEQLLAGRFSNTETSCLKAWLYTVARNRAINSSAKSRKLSLEAVEHTNKYNAEQSDAESALIVNDRTHALSQIESKMPEDLRATWRLRKQGQDYKTIANTLCIPLGTVKSRFHRLVEYLRKELENEI